MANLLFKNMFSSVWILTQSYPRTFSHPRTFQCFGLRSIYSSITVLIFKVTLQFSKNISIFGLLPIFLNIVFSIFVILILSYMLFGKITYFHTPPIYSPIKLFSFQKYWHKTTNFHGTLQYLGLRLILSSIIHIQGVLILTLSCSL